MIVLKGPRESLDAVTFSPDGGTIATASWQRVRLWTNWVQATASPKELPEEYTTTLRFSPGGEKLLASGGLHWVWYLAGEECALVRGAEGDGYQFADLTPDGGFVIVCGTNTRREHPGSIYCHLADNPDLLRWAVHSSRRLESPPLFLPNGGRFLAVEFHYDRESFSDCRYVFVLRDTHSGAEVEAVPAVCGQLNKPVLSPTGAHLVGMRTNSLYVLGTSVLDREPIRLPSGSKKHFTGVAFHPSGRYLAATSNDATVKLYDTSNWQVARMFTWDIGRMRCVAFSPDGTLAAAGSDTGKIVVWDVEV